MIQLKDNPKHKHSLFTKAKSTSAILAGALILGCLLFPGFRQLPAGTAAVGATETDGADRDESAETEDADRDLITGEGYVLAVEADGRRLYIHAATSEIYVEDVASGRQWHSNPQDRDEDEIANGANKQRLGSQIQLSYYTPAAQQIQKDNYLDAISGGQFEIERLQDGVKVTYIIGDALVEYVHPVAITVERFQEIFDQSEREAQRIMNRRYTLYDIDEMSGSQAAELLERYPGLADQPLYILRDGIAGFILEEISAAFEAAGYTEEEKIADETLAGMEAGDSELQNVTLSLYYSLDGGDLIVRMPVDEIEFDESYPLHQIRLLDYFGAGGLEDEGYLFVPDGSGALIHLNNRKLAASQYLSPVYGNDIAVRSGLQVGMSEQVALPVYGIKNGEQGFLAIIESGSSLASIRADISGRTHSYNTVAPVFQILARDEVDLRELAGNNVIMAYQQTAYEGDIRIRYRFLTDEAADYSGMATTYRDYLLDSGALTPLTEERLPLQLEVLGAVDLIKPLVGIPVNTVQRLTSFNETAEIVGDLTAAGITDIDLRLSGWFNGGIRQSVPNRLNIQRQLGGQRDFDELTALLREQNVNFYPDATFTYAHRNSLFDSFIQTRDAMRFLDREVVELGAYQPSMMSVPPNATPFWAIAPRQAAEYAASFLGRYGELGTGGLSIRDLGRDLGANYHRSRELDRESALQIWETTLDQVVSDGLSVLAEYGNAYVLPYADVLIDLPSGSSRYQILDASIPFLQMVLHGSVDYSLEAMNLSSDTQDNFLTMLETGANPRFVVMKESNSILKDSAYNYYFSVEYDSWRDPILETYEELEGILAPLRTSNIVRHEILADNVTKTSYSNGRMIYVNRSNVDFESEDGVVAASDYLATGN